MQWHISTLSHHLVLLLRHHRRSMLHVHLLRLMEPELTVALTLLRVEGRSVIVELCLILRLPHLLISHKLMLLLRPSLSLLIPTIVSCVHVAELLWLLIVPSLLILLLIKLLLLYLLRHHHGIEVRIVPELTVRVTIILRLLILLVRNEVRLVLLSWSAVLFLVVKSAPLIVFVSMRVLHLLLFSR